VLERYQRRTIRLAGQVGGFSLGMRQRLGIAGALLAIRRS
jgi:ABC-type multidrug transport system ATPase subunit